MSSVPEPEFSDAQRLGQPIPPIPHAVSVCLPTWADNVGYEKGEARVVDRMQSGYPRFFLHPSVVRLFKQCEERFAQSGERSFVFPSRRVAERGAAFIRRRQGATARIDPLTGTPLFAVTFPREAFDAAKAYWQHTGQIVSSRLAERVLAGSIAAHGFPPAAGLWILVPQMARVRSALRNRLAALMQVPPEDVWLFPSGMAAIETAFRAMQRLRPRAKSVQFGFPYVDSLKLQETCGQGTHFFPRGDATDLKNLASVAAAEPLLGLFCEFPGNPLLASPDLKRIDALGAAHDFPILVDDTLGALINADVLPAADLVSCSLTKFFSGAGNVMAGALTLNSKRPRGFQLREALIAEYEDVFDAEDAAVLEQNSRDCVDRVRKINRTAERLCDFLQMHPAVERIDYPKYRDAPLYRAFLRPEGGCGGLFSIALKNPERNAPAFFDALAIAKGPNLGTNFSLCCPYTLLAHFNELDFAERCGISRYLLRVSIGLEDFEWLKDCFERALRVVTS